MAHHERRPERADFLGRRHLHDDLRGHHRVRAAFRPHDPALRRRQGHCGVRGADGVRIAGIFLRAELLDAAGARHSLWLGCGRRRCGAQQLCRHSLRKPPHELAARHVGIRYADRSVHHELRVGSGAGMVVGLSIHLHPAVRIDRGVGRQPALVEGPWRHVRGRRRGWRCRCRAQAARHPRSAGDSRSPRDSGDVLLLLRA